MQRVLTVRIERWPIARPFAISRGAKSEAVVVVAEIAAAGATGRGECVPYARYGETIEGVVATIEGLRQEIAAGLDRLALQGALPPGAARNAVDCALWDLEAKEAGRRAWELAGLAAPAPVVTAYTISLAEPAAMAAAARETAHPLLKLKLGAPGDPARLRAVRAAVPDRALIVDANEGWNAKNLAENLLACAGADVKLIEQPLPAHEDSPLADFARTVPVCADESLHSRAELGALRGRYEAINIKLDKAGGLSEAMALADAARKLGFGIMIGSMVSTSLGIAPALLLAAHADFVDLDGPLLLARDRTEGTRIDGALVHPPSRELWG